MNTAEASPGARWLITGARGQLGRSLTALGRDRDLEILACDLAELDIRDPQRVEAAFAEFAPQVCVNCAAYTQVDRAESDEAAAVQVNGEAPGVLARAARGRCLLIHLSTEYVFDGRGSEPIPEDAPPRPLSAYGRSKLAGEQAVVSAGGDWLMVRSQWIFGPGPNFVRTILEAARRGEPLRVVDDQVGRPTWSGALAAGLVETVERGARGLLHLACEGVASWYDLARTAVAEGARRGMNPLVAVEPISSSALGRPAPRPAYAVLGLDRARGLGLSLGDWRDALGAYLDAEAKGGDLRSDEGHP